MRPLALVIVTLLVGASSGCVSNMADLKDTLGFDDPPAPTPDDPAPDAQPPVARARVNVTRAHVGSPIRFTAANSMDPEDLPLDFTWDFGDGARLPGETVTHTYRAPGLYRVTLTATNSEGKAARDSLNVDIQALNQPPRAQMSALNEKGAVTTSTTAGRAIKFSAEGSLDPEGQPLTFQWDFGDGNTGAGQIVEHVYAKPGNKLVALTVVDAGGLTATASKLVGVNYNLTARGEFTPQDTPAPDPAGGGTPSYNATRVVTFPIAPGASALVIELTFEAQLGANNIDLVLREGETRISANVTETAPLAQGQVTKRIALPSEALRVESDREWNVQITRTKGFQVAYTLTIQETY